MEEVIDNKSHFIKRGGIFILLTWIRCPIGYRTPNGNFKIVYEIYDGYKLIHTRSTGQTMYLCDSFEDAKMQAEKIYRQENPL